MESNRQHLPSRRVFLRKAALAVSVAPLGRLLANSQREPKIDKVPYVDGMILLLENPPRNLEDVRNSGLTAFIADVSSAAPLKPNDGTTRFFRSFEACARSITAMRRKLRSEPNGVFLATHGSEIMQAFRSGRTAVFFQFQGCEPMGEDLSRLDLFYELGLRVLQITHHNNNPFGGGALEKQWTGLTKLGFEAVERMNALGIIPDLSHASDLTAMDVSKTSRKPVILSHGAARALVDNARCAPDQVIRGVAKSGGVMGIFMMSFWLTKDPVPTIDAFIEQLRHVINVGGIDAVGIANDFSVAGQLELAKLNNNNAEGVKSYFPWWDSIASDGILGFDKRPAHVVIPELNSVKRMFVIHEALEKRGFKAVEIEKIIGGNWIRVLTECLG